MRFSTLTLAPSLSSIALGANLTQRDEFRGSSLGEDVTPFIGKGCLTIYEEGTGKYSGCNC
jgi:hypothetical protein